MANINIADASKQAVVLEAEGKAQSIIAKAEAQAEALKQIESQLNKKGGFEAAQFILGQRYIQSYKNLARRSNTLIMPTQPTDVDKQIKTSLNLLEKNE